MQKELLSQLLTARLKQLRKTVKPEENLSNEEFNPEKEKRDAYARVDTGRMSLKTLPMIETVRKKTTKKKYRGIWTEDDFGGHSPNTSPISFGYQSDDIQQNEILPIDNGDLKVSSSENSSDNDIQQQVSSSENSHSSDTDCQNPESEYKTIEKWIEGIKNMQIIPSDNLYIMLLNDETVSHIDTESFEYYNDEIRSFIQQPFEYSENNHKEMVSYLEIFNTCGWGVLGPRIRDNLSGTEAKKMAKKIGKEFGVAKKNGLREDEDESFAFNYFKDHLIGEKIMDPEHLKSEMLSAFCNYSLPILNSYNQKDKHSIILMLEEKLVSKIATYRYVYFRHLIMETLYRFCDDIIHESGSKANPRDRRCWHYNQNTREIMEYILSAVMGVLERMWKDYQQITFETFREDFTELVKFAKDNKKTGYSDIYYNTLKNFESYLSDGENDTKSYLPKMSYMINIYDNDIAKKIQNRLTQWTVSYAIDWMYLNEIEYTEGNEDKTRYELVMVGYVYGEHFEIKQTDNGKKKNSYGIYNCIKKVMQFIENKE
jgi:hypothetical protein